MNQAVDFLSRPIHPGDTVVYPWRRGAGMGLNKLCVTQVADDHISGYSTAGRLIRIVNLKNVVVISLPAGAH